MKLSEEKERAKIIERMFFWFPLYFPIAPIIGFIFTILRATRRVKIKGLERLRFLAGGMILIANHPSTFDPILKNLLYFPAFMLHPHRLVLVNTPGKKEYYDGWWYCLFGLRPNSIPVDRQNHTGHEGRLVLRRIIKALKEDRVISMFPEGTRTRKTDAKVSNADGTRAIGQLKPEIGWLAARSQATVVPIWFEGTDKFLPPGLPFPRFWRQITIHIGEPFVVDKDASPEEATEIITKALFTA
jgi:1-acyl-sn-glycerol-3-phosphate acyltransferase